MKHLNILGIILALLLYSSTPLHSTVTWFDLDYYTDFANPERGFYHPESQTFKESQQESNFPASTITAQRKLRHTLFLREYHLNNYRSDSIPEYALNIILQDFETCRQAGGKLIIRFAYTSSQNTPYKDASPEWWRIHLEQLKPILAQGEDVISCVQAGFLGVWGEWYYSSQGTGGNIKQQIKTDLINQLLDAVPASRAIQLRTPAYKTAYLNKDTVPLTPEEAFNGSPKARLGHHNDAMLNDKNNMGTYVNRTLDMSYLNRDCRYLPNGGETDLTNDQANAQKIYNEWSTGAIAHEELNYLHYSYVNHAYSPFVLNKWKEEFDGNGHAYYDIISAHLGYRFGVQQTSLPDSIAPNGNLPIRLIIANTGYATPYNERHAYLVLKNETDTLSFPIASDPRFWTSGAQTLIDEQFAVPADAPEGVYDVCLFIPDPAKTLAKNPLFAIRLCNTDCWEETSGYNNLHLKMTISSDAPSDPVIEPIAVGLNNPQSTIHTPQSTDRKRLINNQLVIANEQGLFTILGQKL